MKQIPLTQGKVALVDDEDYERLSAVKWCARPGNSRAKMPGWYATRRNEQGKNEFMHRVILGCSRDEIGDHRNGDTLDNRRTNLRKCNKAENSRNNIRRTGASGFRGVAWFPENGKWRAHGRIGGKMKNIGYYATREEAAVARDDRTREVCGEFGTYNFPRPGERSAFTGEIAPRAPNRLTPRPPTCPHSKPSRPPRP